MKKTRFVFLLLLATAVCMPSPASKRMAISKEELMDKIKGAWAGQTIGCTYGGPTEFKYLGRRIPDYENIKWDDGKIKWYFDNVPGLYDDVYMDLTFIQVMHEQGLNAPAKAYAKAFADAEYPLWHANQAARYNIQRGINPPRSGHWKYNPHADDIDYQIEADFAGIITPGMPNTASRISDRIGHLMNYGNGWYGGVYVGAMYSLAFVYDDVETIAVKALQCIPEKSSYHRCMKDVIAWHRQYPGNWKKTWQLCQDNYANEVGCPDGVKAAFDIDAVINSAYILIGLLYGEGDFARTMEIATRCGQDSDCNPASAGGILGCILGYSKIPERWMKNLRDVEDRKFAYTTLSLNDTYRYSMELAEKLIMKNGGKDRGSKLEVKVQEPKPVRFEESFPNLRPRERRGGRSLAEFGTERFEGKGIVVSGNVKSKDKDYVAEIDVFVDGKFRETMTAPANFHDRTGELYWTYDLKKGTHELSLKWKNPNGEAKVNAGRILIYE